MKSATIIIAVALTVLAFSCRKDVRNNGGKNDAIPVDHSEIEKKYLAEGFVEKDVFRVVIVNPKNDPMAQAELKNRGMKRAISSMEKYIQESDRKAGANTRAGILGLVQSHGSFYRKSIDRYPNEVYYFDVRKDNIRKYVMSLGEK